jgi:hypothetical protein
MIKFLTSLAVFAAMLPASVSADEQMVVIDPTSERVLTEACGYLRSATGFSVDMAIDYEEVLLDGTTVTYHREDTVTLQRPDRLRVDVVDDRGARSIFINQGKMTVFRPANGVYAELDVSGSIDQMIANAESWGLTLPMADLLQEKPCGDLVQYMQTATYAGRHYLAGQQVHHLLIDLVDVDLQLWVADGDAPEIVKAVIRYREKPGQPRYTASMNNWNIERTNEDPFVFTPPDGVRKVEFRKPAAAQEEK